MICIKLFGITNNAAKIKIRTYNRRIANFNVNIYNIR